MVETDSNKAETSLKRGQGISPGAVVIVVLHSPREKCWGVLEEINAAGVLMRGLDLNAFDDWVQAVTHDEPFMSVSDHFFPMWRVERISRDESAGGVPSLAEQFEQRTKRKLPEFF
jgi:hypothetical protein